jgi:hypothetical protein
VASKTHTNAATKSAAEVRVAARDAPRRKHADAPSDADAAKRLRSGFTNPERRDDETRAGYSAS